MNHTKRYFRHDHHKDGKHIIVEGPLTGAALAQLTFDDGLTAFRRPDEQFIAVQEIADLPEGRIIICRNGTHIIGYTTFLYPDPMERWSLGNLPYLLELGAIEVSLDYRSLGLGKEMLKLSMLMIRWKIISSSRQSITGTGI